MGKKLLRSAVIVYLFGLVSNSYGGLLLHYKLDETWGNIARDSSGRGCDGAVESDGPSWDPDGQLRGCLAFDDDTVVNPPSYVLGDVNDAITISVWLDGFRPGGDNWVFETGTGDAFLGGIVPDAGGDVYFRAGQGGYDTLTWEGSEPGDWMGSWNHYAFVKDEHEGMMWLYHNGVAVAQKMGTTYSLERVRNTTFDIGAKLSHANDYIGKMDDFRIYDYAMSAAEITKLFRAEADPAIAWNPSPSDGAEGVFPQVILIWSPGDYVASHHVYFGTNFDDVNDADTLSGEYKGSFGLDANSYEPGVLELGRSYYWRIDEVNEANNDVRKGWVWSFTVDEGKSRYPRPVDGALSAPSDARLNWTAGPLAASHDVYLGTSFEKLRDASTVVTLDVYKGWRSTTSYDPCGLLALDTVYYWRIDEVSDGTHVKGDVWSFKSAAVRLRHIVVYEEPGRFCGWPANNGIWMWGEEILVGFELGYYKERSGHNYDPDKPKYNVLARSLDSGESWSLEHRFGAFDDSNLKPFPGGADFTHPGFAFRTLGSDFHISYDRGKTWEGAYAWPTFGQPCMQARTDYIVNSQSDCLFFLTACKTNGSEGRPLCVRTTNSGATFGFVCWIGPEPSGYSIMPSTVRCSETKLVTAIRRRESSGTWIETYLTNDDGQTWDFLSWVAPTGGNNGNPPGMVRLRDGRLCVTYGFRGVPYGIRAKISSDEGQTWSEEIILRDDGREWDLGYPRTVQRMDGSLVTIYYFTTDEHPEQFIGGTIWEVPAPTCAVDFRHFARFAEQWLDSGSGLAADLDGDNVVDLFDLSWFVDEWLYSCPHGWQLR